MSRRRNAPAPEPEVEFDATRFMSAKAQSFFEKYSTKGFAVENEFNPAELGLDGIFANYGWGNLARRPSNKGSKVLVREFYANAFEEGQVRKCGWVRGTNVYYNAEDINTFYGMASPLVCDYHSNAQIMEANVAGNLHLLEPSFVNVDVTLLRNGNVRKARDMDLRMRALHRFICERIMPTSHYNDVHWRRALLMNIVLTGQRFNTGRAMSREIVNTIRTIGRCSFNFPLLISGMIERRGVSFPRLKIVRDIVSSGTAVTKRSLVVKGHAHLQPGEGSSRGVRGDEVDEDMEEHEFTPTEAAYYVGGQVEALSEEIGQLRGHCETMDQRLGRMESMATEEFYAASMWRQRMEDAQSEMFQELMHRLPPPPPPQHIPYQPPRYRTPEQMSGWGTWEQQQQQQNQQQQQQQQQQFGADSSGSGSVGPWDQLWR